MVSVPLETLGAADDVQEYPELVVGQLGEELIEEQIGHLRIAVSREALERDSSLDC